MKLEAQFKSESNKLYFLDGTELNAKESAALNCSQCLDLEKLPEATDKLLNISVEWSKVGMDEESYDENFLASFRDYLKALEEKKIYAFVQPIADKIPSSDSEKEAYTASFKHCARRIKDCTSIVGFAVPAEVDSDFFMEELSAKHKHYIYFSKDSALLSKNANIVEF